MPLSYGIWAVAALGNIAIAIANDASVVSAFFMFIEVSKNIVGHCGCNNRSKLINLILCTKCFNMEVSV